MSISSFLKKKFLKSLFFPSHNRGEALPKNLIELLNEQPGLWDLPELPELGSPLSNKGIISDVQEYFSTKFSTNSCWFGVNGASGLIQSGIIAMTKPGDYLLIPRNIHISVIKICLLANVIPIFFDLPYSESTGQYLPLTKDWLENIFEDKLLREKNPSGIIIVNPSYQGYSTNLDPLVDICHKRNLPLLVDEAHGSYFLFCEEFGLPKSAVRSNADLVVHSLHKSLNGLTQTAIMWHSGNNLDKKKIIRSLNLLQTTSPNSLLLASCEESINDWINKDNLAIYKNRINKARFIFEQLLIRNVPLIKTDDPLKIVLDTGSYGIDGFLADRFFYKNGIIAELPEMMTLTFCLGFGNQDGFVDIFYGIWQKLISGVKRRDELRLEKPPFKLLETPEMSPSQAWYKKTYELPIKESVGRISADIVCPYPPGIPLLVPGERIEKERVEWLLAQSLYNDDLVDFYIRVLPY